MQTEGAQDKIMQLRKTKGVIPDFPKALMGGYQCREVDEYILNMKTNADQSQTVLKEKLEEYASEFNLLSQEKERLLKLKRDYETQIAQLTSEITLRAQAESQLKSEYEKIKIVAEDLRDQLESSGLKALAEKNRQLEKEKTLLLQEKNQLAIENEVARRKEEAMEKSMEESKKKNEQLVAYIDSSMISRRNDEMAVNLRLYEFRHKQETNIGYAAQRLQEIAKIMELLKTELADMYENTKLNTEYEKA